MKTARTAKCLTAVFFIGFLIQTMSAGFACAGYLQQGYEPISLFNDRLRVSGTFDTETKYRLKVLKSATGVHNEERHARSSKVSMVRSNLSLELNWWAVQKPDFEINVISHLYYSYDFTGHFDGRFQRNIPNRSYHQYIRTADKDIIRELFVQILKGDWDVRIGKQQVIWGEQLGQRTLDVINPLDLRTQVIGLTEWENVRIGLWMIRMIRHTSLPGELDFEAILIPNDFESFKMPLEGTYLGGISRLPGTKGPTDPGTLGFQDQLWRAMEHDKPSRHGLHGSEWGFRVRGFAAALDLDWSAMFFHTIDDGPVTKNMDQFLGWLGGYPGVPYYKRPHIPKGTFTYRPYNIFGFSLQRYFAMLEAVLKLEVAYEDNRNYDAEGGRVVERDAIGVGFAIDKDMKVPYLYELQGNQAMSFSVELNQLWWRDYRESIDFSRTHPRGDTYDTSISWSATLHFFDDRFMPMCRGTYYLTSDAGKTAITLYFKPGQHWSYSLSLSMYWAKRSDRTPSTAMEKRDALGLKIAYIF